jgi:hypothetical protein
MKGIFSASIAMGTGILILLGYFLPIPILVNLRMILLQWAVIVAGAVVLVGCVNLLATHAMKIKAQPAKSAYSMLVIIFLLISFIFGNIPGFESISAVILDSILIPVETSLMAILSVTLIYAIVRMFRARLDLMSIVFFATVVIMLFAMIPLPFLGEIPGTDLVRSYLAQVFAAGGARGILIGVALGTLTTGLRVLLGADRPYGSK